MKGSNLSPAIAAYFALMALHRARRSSQGIAALKFDRRWFYRTDVLSRNCSYVVQLPAALPLFATGLGALGLLGWRKKRKA